MSFLQALNSGLINTRTEPASYSYDTLTYPITSPLSIGYQAYGTYTTSVALSTLNTWTLLYANTTDYPAGVYMLSAVFTFDSSSTGAIINNEYLQIGLVDTLTGVASGPTLGNKCGTSNNQGIINMTVPFISDGDTKTNIIFAYNTAFANTTVTNIAFTLVRVG